MSYQRLIEACRDLLINFPGAKEVAEYVNSRLSFAAQEKFSFGYFPSDEHLNVLSSEVGYNELSDMGLVFDRVYKDGLGQKNVRYSTMANHNMILPYRDVYGEIVGIVGRTILSEEKRKELKIPKYKNSQMQKRSHLFGLYEAKDSILENNLVYIVEGQIDKITAHDKGMENVVGLGSSNMTFDQVALLTRYTDNIILLLDNDEPGNIGADRIMNSYGKYANIRKARVPNGFKDLDEYLRGNDGRVEFVEW